MNDLNPEILAQAAELVITNQFASPLFVQRRLHVGYGRATAILDELHRRWIVGPANGDKARDVIVKVENIDQALEQLRAVWA